MNGGTINEKHGGEKVRGHSLVGGACDHIKGFLNIIWLIRSSRVYSLGDPGYIV